MVGKAGGGGKIDSRGKGFVGCLHVSVLNPRKGRDQDWKGRGGMGRDGKEEGMSSKASGVRKCIWYTDSCWFVCQIDRYRGRWRREISSSRTLAAVGM